MPLGYDFHDTYRIIQQPWYGRVAFPSPWTSLAPHAADGEVLSGPSHSLSVVIGVALGLTAWRRRWSVPTVLGAMGVALALRPALEPAIAPYYLWPAFAVALILVATRSAHFGTIAVVLAGAFLTLQRNLGPWWVWYTLAMLSLAMAVAVAFGRPRRWQARVRPVRRRQPAGSVGASRTVPANL